MKVHEQINRTFCDYIGRILDVLEVTIGHLDNWEQIRRLFLKLAHQSRREMIARVGWCPLDEADVRGDSRRQFGKTESDHRWSEREAGQFLGNRSISIQLSKQLAGDL